MRPILIFVCILVACAVQAICGGASGATPPATVRAACPHPLPADGKFTASERWAWDLNICIGQVADLSRYPDGGPDTKCDPQNSGDWSGNRTLSNRFLNTIATMEPYRSVQRLYSISVKCAIFDEEISIVSQTIASVFIIQNSRFMRSLSIANSEFKSYVAIENSHIAQTLNADQVDIKGNLILQGSHLGGISLQGASIGDNFDASAMTVENGIAASRMQVRGSLIMNRGRFKTIDLFNAKVLGVITLAGSTISQSFLAQSIQIAGNFLLDENGKFGSVDVSNAFIGGSITARTSQFDGVFRAGSLQVMGNVYLDEGAVFSDLILSNAVISRGSLFLRKSTFKRDVVAENIDVHGALIATRINVEADASLAFSKIGNDLALDDGAAFGYLNLSNSVVGANLRMNGSHVHGNFVAEQIKINGSALLNGNAEFDGDVNLFRAQITGLVALDHSKVHGDLGMASAQIGGSLHLNDGGTFGRISLLNANIGGDLRATKTNFTDQLGAERVTIAGSADLSSSKFEGSDPSMAVLDLFAADLKGALILKGATLKGDLFGLSMKVGGSVAFADSKLKGVALSNASVGGDLGISDTSFEGKLVAERLSVAGSVTVMSSQFASVDLAGADVRGSLLMDRSECTGGLLFRSGRVGGTLFLYDNSKFVDVDLVNTSIGGDLNLTNAIIGGSLLAEKMTVAGGMFFGGGQFSSVNLFGSTVRGTLRTDGAVFAGDFLAQGIVIGDNLLLNSGARFEKVNLSNAQINHEVQIDNAAFSDELTAEKVSIGGLAKISGKSQMARVNWFGARIGATLRVDASRLDGGLTLDSAYIGNNMYFNDGAKVSSVSMRNTTIGGDLEVRRAVFDQDFDAAGVKVGGDILLGDGARFSSVDLDGSELSRRITIGDAEIDGVVNLSRADVKAMISLGQKKPDAVRANEVTYPRWRENAKLLLANARTQKVETPLRAWRLSDRGGWLPADLDGFKYVEIELTDQANAGEDAVAVPTPGKIEWLRGVTWAFRQGYNPAPFDQLAGVFRSAGRIDDADTVVFNKWEARRASASWVDWLLLSISWLAFGYGLRPMLLVFWICVLVGAGVVLASYSKHFEGIEPGRPLYRRVRYRLPEKLRFSFENAVPLLPLEGSFQDMRHGSQFIATMFLLQQVVGFMLATIAVTTLTLLAK